MRTAIGFGLCLMLAGCGKPAPTQIATPQAPQAPQIRIGQVGDTVFAPTVSGSATVIVREAQATPGRAAPAAVADRGSANGFSLVTRLPAGDAARLELGATAQARFAIFEDDVVVGRVVRIAAPAGGLAEVEITLPRDSRLQAGQRAAVLIVAKGAGTTLLAVPRSALVWAHDGEAAVMVVDLATSRVHPRSVGLGDETPNGFPVTRGLKKGEWIALTRAQRLEDGMKIAPLGPES